MSLRFPKPIILASRSPRRQELLRQIGVDFELLDSDIDETVLPSEKPENYVQRMALEKAQCAWQLAGQQMKLKTGSEGLLTADTSVVKGELILGKPKNRDHAKEMLESLADSQHRVITSVALVNKVETRLRTSITEVAFGSLSERMIEDYLDTGEGLDKAGSYAIQGIGSQFIKSINGSYSGVVGLPLYETCQLLDMHFKDLE